MLVLACPSGKTSRIELTCSAHDESHLALDADSQTFRDAIKVATAALDMRDDETVLVLEHQKLIFGSKHVLFVACVPNATIDVLNAEDEYLVLVKRSFNVFHVVKVDVPDEFEPKYPLFKIQKGHHRCEHAE